VPKTTKVSIATYGPSFQKTLKLIDIFKKRNKMMNLKVEIRMDFSFQHLGYYVYDGSLKAVIFLNPANCINAKGDELIGFPSDDSMCSVIFHEFSHFLDDILNLEEQYLLQDFDKKSMPITKYALTNTQEELAELMAVYFINPYLVYLIAPERFNWLKRIIKSPSPCSLKSFIRHYNRWSIKLKTHTFDIFGIKVNNKGEIYKEEPKFKYEKTKDGKFITIRKKSPEKCINSLNKNICYNRRRVFYGIKKDN